MPETMCGTVGGKVSIDSETSSRHGSPKNGAEALILGLSLMETSRVFIDLYCSGGGIA